MEKITPGPIRLAGGATAVGDNKDNAAVRVSRLARCKLLGDWYRQQNQSLLCDVMSFVILRIFSVFTFIN